MNKVNKYFKIKVKAFNGKTELLITITAHTLKQAILKAHEHCAYTRNIFYVIEESIFEISEQEYIDFTQKKSV